MKVTRITMSCPHCQCKDFERQKDNKFQCCQCGTIYTEFMLLPTFEERDGMTFTEKEERAKLLKVINEVKEKHSQYVLVVNNNDMLDVHYYDVPGATNATLYMAAVARMDKIRHETLASFLRMNHVDYIL